MNEFKRFDNEDENAYIWRICDNKESIGTWQDVCDILNKELNHEYNESWYRKMYQSFVTLFKVVKDKYFDDEHSKYLDEKILAMQKERQKLNATKIEYSRDIRQQSRFELFYENIKNTIQTLEVPQFIDRLAPKTNKEYILTIADIHCGAKFISENNEYSYDICRERFETLLSEVIEFVKEKELNHINILELGDSIQGILRLNDLKINESSVVEATVIVSQLISNFLNSLSKYCNIDYYHCPTSNHSQMRNLNSKASELASEDIEYIICNYIKDTLSNNDKITIHTNFGKEYIEIDNNVYNIISMHGHKIKNINTALSDLSQLKRTFYDIVFLAHYHGGSERIVGENITCDAEVIVCPSFIGSDPYSDSLMKGSKAACCIYGIDEYKGHTETYKIILN